MEKIACRRSYRCTAYGAPRKARKEIYGVFAALCEVFPEIQYIYLRRPTSTVALKF